MQTTFVNAREVLLTAILLAPVLPGSLAGGPVAAAQGTPPDKARPATVAELKDKLTAGTFKLAEADVVKLVGPPAVVKRPGDAGSELRMHWNYATYIFATFKDGKLADSTGAFSENLPVERVTLANFKRLRVGMTEAEVVAVLGEGKGTATVGTTTVRSWGRTALLWVSFNAKGRAFNAGLQEASALSMPPEAQLRLTEILKQ
jgi:hypothetical protein